MKRDPTKEPRIGDKWKHKTFYKKVWEIVEVSDDLIWWKYEDSDCRIALSIKNMNIEHWPQYAEFLGNEKEKEEMNTPDPVTNPQVGDYWERTSWKQIIIFSEENRVILLEKRNDDCKESLWDTSLDQFKATFKGRDYKFIGNHPEKMAEFKTLNGVKMNNATLIKENLTERERAITNPQAGDRWIWGDGVSIEVNDIGKPFYGESELRVCYATNTRGTNSQSMKVWRSFVHAATFIGNFVPKTENRDPKKNPQSGDRWQTTIFYHNNMYDGTTKGITVGSTLMISEVANRESDTFVYGYFTDGTKFICPMKEFEARTQSFKFVE